MSAAMIVGSHHRGRVRIARSCARSLCCLLFCFGVVLSAVAAPSDAVEKDAQEYTRLAMRHDSLLLKLNLKRITPAEEAEMPELRAKVSAIKTKYARGGPLSSQAGAFDKR